MKVIPETRHVHYIRYLCFYSKRKTIYLTYSIDRGYHCPQQAVYNYKFHHFVLWRARKFHRH